MSKLGSFFNKYVFPALTVVNTISAVAAIFYLFDSIEATPLTAFMATWLCISVFIGWLSIYYENVLCKKKD